MSKNRAVHQRVLDFACMDCDTLFERFHISSEGYSEEEAEKSRIRYGGNELSSRASDTIFYRLGRAFINPFSIILFVLALISFVTDVLPASNFSRDMTTVIIILCMLLISGVLRFIQELRAKRMKPKGHSTENSSK